MTYTKAKYDSLQLQVLDSDSVIGRCIRKYGEFARPEADLLIQIAQNLAPGMMLDVGANIGTISLPFAKAMPSWQVVCFEPQLAVLAALNANMIENGLVNTRVLPWVVGAESGLTLFPQPSATTENNFGAVGADGMQNAARLPAVAIRLDDLNLTNVRIIKVDVEGYELEVLHGAVTLTESQRPIWLLEAKSGEKAEQCMQWLLDRGYVLYWFFAPFVTPKVGAEQAEYQLGDVNFLAVPKDTLQMKLPEIKSLNEDWQERMKELSYLSIYGYEV